MFITKEYEELTQTVIFPIQTFFYVSQYLLHSNAYLDPCSASVFEINLKLIKNQDPDEFFI